MAVPIPKQWLRPLFITLALAANVAFAALFVSGARAQEFLPCQEGEICSCTGETCMDGMGSKSCDETADCKD